MRFKSIFAALAVASAVLSGPSQAKAPNEQITVVLVHGAFAESSSWDEVTRTLEGDGYRVVAAANPLRGVRSDAEYVGRIVAGLDGPVVLVGHSYGGEVISDPAAAPANVKSLVFVSAFAPDKGETGAGLAARFPGSTLASALGKPVDLGDGTKDLYIDQAKFPAQFAGDVAPAKAALMAAAQRPVRDSALGEAAREPNWKHIPSWFVYGSADKNIPPAAMNFMAERAGSRGTKVVPGASHVVMVSQPRVVADMIETAARD